ncbi:unnamed protein product [Vicia faba]|uniref:Uncharacterized protein n=1 Tax=Vicia faba TaxID=3906 RepID=A0AAV1A1C2_VICFA|nr:unnamed protein product [Vicia faba]
MESCFTIARCVFCRVQDGYEFVVVVFCSVLMKFVEERLLHYGGNLLDHNGCLKWCLTVHGCGSEKKQWISVVGVFLDGEGGMKPSCSKWFDVLRILHSCYVNWHNDVFIVAEPKDLAEKFLQNIVHQYQDCQTLVMEDNQEIGSYMFHRTMSPMQLSADDIRWMKILQGFRAEYLI